MPLNSLPLEVLQIIIRLIPRGSLAPASLVSKTWRSMTLPLLYQSIWLPSRVDGDQRREEFVKKIITECEDGDEDKKHWFRLSDCVKRLHVESDMDEQELKDFSSAVAKIRNLEHLGWTVSNLLGVEWYTTLVHLYQELPKLRSLSLTMAQNEIFLGDLEEVVPFTNLQELSITFDGLTDEEPDEELPNTLVELIRGARNIESLSLFFEEDDEKGAAPWGSIDLFLELASDCFPNLRILEIRSQHLVPIDNYSGPEFRQFIRNHNKLQKILLFTGGYDNTVKLINPPPPIVTPRDMEEMMPSIQHFAGPGLLVGALLKSGLAKQIELLEFREPAATNLGRLSDLLIDLDDSTLPELSNLKGLGLFTSEVEEESEWENMQDVLSRLAIRMPVLKELLLCADGKASPDELDKLLQTLIQLPHLRRLVAQVQGYCGNESDATQRFFEHLKTSCPLLEIGDDENLVLSLALS
ncbi:unnamed protein product [Rhizoctonia solani]|uniref:F-box domain-containing protein n=1 Tax=Rhizoctonia solani TaxID=456999 RepID=A0A8H3BYI8_9AGAM|nr:unnamed protein product [Rhizoctonia solani]